MIEVTVQNIDNKNILAFKYDKEVFFGSMGEEDMKLITLLPKKAITQLMNMCMTALRDIKNKENEELEKESHRIRFIGVDY